MSIVQYLTHPPIVCTRAGGVLLAGVLLFAAACGGGGQTSPSTGRSDAGSPLGRAESATPAPGAAARTPAGASPAGAGPDASPGGGAAAAAVATPHPDTPNPCALVTQAEVETALGARPLPGRERRSRDSAEVRCTFDDLGNGRSAVVSVWRGTEARSVYELRRSMYGQGATVEEIRGLGDRAFAVTGDEGWVNVLRGDVYLSIQVINQTPAAEQGLHGEELRGRALTLARAALGRLSLGAAGGASTGTPAAAVASSPATDPAAARAADRARTVATAQATAQAQAQTPGADPCRVATKEELEAALGFALSPGQRGTGPIGDAECAYKAQSDPTPGTMPEVTVNIYRSRLARTTFDTLRETASSRAADVPGLGDKAYVFIGGGLLDNREIQVLRGDVLFAINVTTVRRSAVSMSDEEKREKLIALARTALGRL